MATKKTTAQNNNTSSQGAKPFAFMPVPTAEMTIAAETARKRAEEEARKKAEETARKKAAEEEAKRKAEEAAKKKAQEAARKKVEEAARKKAEEEARKKAEEEAAKKKAQEAARKKAEEAARKKAEEVARKATEEERARRKREEEARRVSAEKEAEARKRAEEVARKKAEEEARKKAEQEVRDKEIEAILLAYCKKKGSLLTDNSRDHAEYDMPRNRYDEIYEYVLRKNKEQRNFCISLNGYDYFFYAASSNKSYGISAWRKINTDGLWDLNEKKNKINGIRKIFAIGLIVLWAIFLIINATYTWIEEDWFSSMIWMAITFAVFGGLLWLVATAEDEHPIKIDSLDAGAIAHLVWRICWVLGLSVISEIIMIVIFAQ